MISIAVMFPEKMEPKFVLSLKIYVFMYDL